MRASKENATAAIEQLKRLSSQFDIRTLPETQFILEFLVFAERKLPSEAAYEKDAQRKR